MTRFQRRSLQIKNVGFFSNLVTDYLSDPKRLQSFFTYSPDLAGLEKSIKNQDFKQNRDELVAIIRRQYEKSGIVLSQKTASSVELLLRPECYTVVTGHQLNLFSGPLFVLYKLLSTIRLSEELKKQFPDRHFVPVYWMASEDHDIEEINHLTLFTTNLKYSTDYRGAAGKLLLKDINILLEELKSILGSDVHSDELMADIKDAYSEGRSLADATRIWINSLLGEYGLIVLDPDEKEFKRLFIDIMKDDLFNHSAYQMVSSSAQQLLHLGYDAQVQPREINLFYLSDQERKRIIQTDAVFKLVDSSKEFTENELMHELTAHPERFSPNVVLRPLFQQSILPNVAYVGGPAEIAYWLEYHSVFTHYKISFPALILRNCMMIVDQNTMEKMDRLGFTPEDFFSDEEELIRNYLTEHVKADFQSDKYSDDIARLFDRISREISLIDSTLKSSVESEKQRLSNALKHLEQKATRALKKKNETEVLQIRKIKEKLFPNGGLQERTETILPFLLRFGKDFIPMIYDQIEPFSSSFSIVVEDHKSSVERK